MKVPWPEFTVNNEERYIRDIPGGNPWSPGFHPLSEDKRKDTAEMRGRDKNPIKN